MKRFDLTWGESVCVRQALANHLGTHDYIEYGPWKLEKMGYTDHYGDPELVEMTKKVIERQTGIRYKYVLLTNGAAGGITLTLRAYQKRGKWSVLTNKGPYFPIYPDMFESAGLKHFTLDKIAPCPVEDMDGVFLMDSPSNPLGIVNPGLSFFAPYPKTPIIWDAVYHNNVYAPGSRHPGDIAEVMIGSYSKLLGLNGIRIGWVATNDAMLFERLKNLADAEYCGLSAPSQEILLSVLKSVHWDEFEKSAKNRLDCNRGEWARLEKYFGDTPVNPVGMFYYGQMDKAARKLFAKAGVDWVIGSKCGDSDDFGRFNLAQDCNLVLQAVISVLRTDVPRSKT